MCSKAVLDEITGRVCAAAKEVLGGKLEKVLLFGSYARGDYDDESDIDIFVLADIPQEAVDDIRDKIRDAMGYLDLEYDAVICLHMGCHAIFYQCLDFLPYYMNIQKEGVVLYAA
jgi:predicted nucleotidyltransferase